jgi:hypothetical protein
LGAVSFIAGGVCALACLILLLPWLRTIPRLATLPALPWPAGAAALVVIAVTLGLIRAAVPTPTSATVVSTVEGAPATQNSWADVSDALGRGVAAAGATGSAPAAARAASMDAAIAALQTRLAGGGGSNDDWELLAKSYEFLGRPQQANQARAHQLPTLPPTTDSGPAASSLTTAANSGISVSGEVRLAAALTARAAAGATIFIVAKSADAPGAPVAVWRSSVGSWPLRFVLDDSESMLPGRNLSSVGSVTIEARISQTGQPLATSGDLQGSSGIVKPRDHKPVRIVIDQVIP